MKIAFTGHRNLDGYSITSPKCQKIRQLVRDELERIAMTIDCSEPIILITGGAIGFDTLAFEVAYAYQQASSKRAVFIEMAVPFSSQACKWQASSQATYTAHKQAANTVVYVDALQRYTVCNTPVGEYDVAKMQARNRFMVDNCDILISCWNKSSGGTAHCVHYAQNTGKLIRNINPDKI